MQKLSVWLKMVSYGMAVALGAGAIAAYLGDALPWLKKADFKAALRTQNELNANQNTLISQNANSINANAERIQRYYVEWIERRIYDARKACRGGDQDACDFAHDLERQIISARAELTRIQRQRNGQIP